MMSSSPWDWQGRSWPLSASFGVATFPGDGREPEALMAVADQAMYSDKRLAQQAALLRASQEANQGFLTVAVTVEKFEEEE